MSKFADKKFWTDTGDRAASTAAQTAVAGLTVTGITGIADVAWPTVLGAALLAGLVSALQSVAARGGGSTQPDDEL